MKIMLIVYMGGNRSFAEYMGSASGAGKLALQDIVSNVLVEGISYFKDKHRIAKREQNGTLEQ
jgi:hypothetical protein